MWQKMQFYTAARVKGAAGGKCCHLSVSRSGNTLSSSSISLSFSSHDIKLIVNVVQHRNGVVPVVIMVCSLLEFRK